MFAQITIGTIAGYNHDNTGAMTLDEFCKFLQKFEDEFEEKAKNTYGNYKYISWLVASGRTVYKEDWGSPKGGEEVFILQTSYTNEYDGDIEEYLWKDNVLRHAKALKEKLNQSTIRIQFINSTTYVLK